MSLLSTAVIPRGPIQEAVPVGIQQLVALASGSGHGPVLAALAAMSG